MIFLRISLCIIIHQATFFITASEQGDFNDLKYFDRRKPDFETFLMPSDFAEASALDDDWDNDDDWPLYNSGKFEGDMDLDVTNLANINSNTGDNDPIPKKDVLYNAVRNRHQLWPDSRIPYAMSNQYSPYSRSVIAAAMEEYALHTCVRWVPRSLNDYDYIYIVPDRGCYSMVGKTGGKQTVSLGTGCIQKGIIMHELMHAVGFFHEQSRVDRDYHITVLWENIQPGMQGQFEKYDHGIIDSLGAEYDYDSIMHYGARAFSRNGQPTLVPKRPAVIGQRLRFSTLDTFKINKLYKCSLSVNQIQTSAVVPQPQTHKKPKPTDATIQLIITDSCKNIRSDCDELVAYGNSHTSRDDYYSEWCTGNPRWMKHYCSKSCNMCTSITVPTCVDQRPDCFTLVQNGHCTISDAFMQAFCPKSCGFCNITETVKSTTVATTATSELPTTTATATTSTAAITRRPGRSKQSLGNAWKKIINSKTNSTKTSTQPTKCSDQKRFCVHWKNAGFCKGLFYGFMMENCQRSCKICGAEDDD